MSVLGAWAARLLPDRGPARILALGYLVDGVGTGLWLATSVLYFTRSVGLPAGQVGLGLSAAGLAGLVAAVPLGHLADERGLRRVGVALMAVQAAMMVVYALLGSFWLFLAVSCLFVAAQRGANAVRNALLGVSVDPERRLRTRAYTRSCANVGFALGALLSVPILRADSGYLAAVAGNGASFVLAAVLFLLLPPVPPRRAAIAATEAAGRARSIALRDRRYVAMTVLSGLLSLHKPVLTVALPLWVSQQTDAPRAFISLLLTVNTVLTVLLQVPLSRGADGYAGGVRTTRRSGTTLAVACVALGLAAGRPTGLAVTLLVVGVAVLTVGELWQSAGGWGLSYDLAPADRHGQYQGVYALGNGIRDTVGPVAVTTLVLGAGIPGWFVLAAGFAVVGLGMAPTLRSLTPRHDPHDTPTAPPASPPSAEPQQAPDG